MQIRLYALLGAILLPARIVALDAQATARCPAIEIDSAGMLHDVFRLADDSMRGRRLGTPGNAAARDFLAARFDALGLGLVGAGRIQPFTYSGTGRGANVVGIITGSIAPAEYIVITAHFDHLGIGRPVNGDSIYNGADDNASGAAALLALARYFSRHKPAHTLLFAEVDGEEEGDLGSRALVATPPVPLAEMLIDVNLDMVGRNAKNELYAAGPTKFPRLRSLTDATIACTPITLRVGHDDPNDPTRDDWTAQSDQEAFYEKGIPFIYFGEEDHPDYHRPSDTADRLMPGFYAAAVRAIADFIQRFDTAPVTR